MSCGMCAIDVSELFTIATVTGGGPRVAVCRSCYFKNLPLEELFDEMTINIADLTTKF